MYRRDGRTRFIASLRRVLFHKHDQREDHDCQYHDATKEAHHVGLHFAGFHVAHTASHARDRLGHAVDDAIDHVGVKGRFDIRDTEYHVAYEQIIQVVDVELAECEAMQETQKSISLYKVMNGCQLEACVHDVGHKQPGERDDHANPGKRIGQDLTDIQSGRARLHVAK